MEHLLLMFVQTKESRGQKSINPRKSEINDFQEKPPDLTSSERKQNNQLIEA